MEGRRRKRRTRQCVKIYLAGGMGSGEPERGIWGVETDGGDGS